MSAWSPFLTSVRWLASMVSERQHVQFIGTCISLDDVRSLDWMIYKARQVTRRTFLRHVPYSLLRTIEVDLGYATHPHAGLTMAGDYHVSYYLSHWKKSPCAFFCWSAIEHVFLTHSLSTKGL